MSEHVDENLCGSEWLLNYQRGQMKVDIQRTFLASVGYQGNSNKHTLCPKNIGSQRFSHEYIKSENVSGLNLVRGRGMRDSMACHCMRVARACWSVTRGTCLSR